MSIVQSREAALANLLGSSEAPHAVDYPDSVTLPDEIHGRTLEALAATENDAHEYSIRFKYRKGAWLGGLMMKGTGPYYSKNGILKASSNRSQHYLNLISRPHFFVHTHPRFTDEQRDESIRIRAELHSWTEEETRRHLARTVLGDQAGYFLPSLGDIEIARRFGPGSVASMVSSARGNFLHVRNYVGWQPRINFDEGEDKAKFEHVAKIRAELKAAEHAVLAKNGSLEETRKELMSVVVEGLRIRNHTCYFSDDPESPNLPRVE